MAIDWTNIYKKYKGLWVGLKDVMEKSKKKGFNSPILFRVPARIIPYIGAF